MRCEVSRCNDTELTASGDGFFARFDSPAHAVEATRAVREAMAALDLETCAGVHSGECVMEGTVLTGVAVQIELRIQAAAFPRQREKPSGPP